MLRGLYTVASGLITNQKKQENLSNNISNINTPGYKNDDIMTKSFDKYLVTKNTYTSNGRVQRKNVGYIEPGVGIDETVTDYTQGIVEETGRNLDFAIQGQGFFTVFDENGEERYTRDGRFRVDADGYLVNSNGYRVAASIDGIGRKEPIIVGNSDIKINSSGVINGESIKTADGEEVSGKARLAIVKFDDMKAAKKLGDNTYVLDGQDALTDLDSSVKQGSLERANIDTIDCITNMISIARSFESNQKVMQQIDETLGKTVNEVGSVR